MTFDITRARAETPGTAHVLHFNNAGAALMPAPVIAAQRDHLDLEARIGGYEAAARAADRIEAVYGSFAPRSITTTMKTRSTASSPH